MNKQASIKSLNYFLGAIIIIVLFLMGLSLINRDKIANGVFVGDIYVGGKNQVEAKTALLAKINKFKNKTLSFSLDNDTIAKNPEELGIDFDTNLAVNEAWQIGKNKNIILGLWEQILAFTLKKNILLTPMLNENELVKNLKVFFKNDQPAKNATIIFDKSINDFKIQKEAEGLIINREKLRQDLTNTFNDEHSTASIILVKIKELPKATAEKSLNALNTTRIIYKNAPFSLTVDSEKNWPITNADIIDLFAYDVSTDGQLKTSLNEKKVIDYLENIAPNINQEPINAQLAMENGKVKAFALSQNGIKLDIEKSAPIVIEKILNSEKSIPLQVTIIKPTITTNSIENLGITSLLATGESDFKGSIPNRIQNIKVASAKFHGALLKPGEEFVFGNILGDIGPEGGYLIGLVIKGNQTVAEYGGGVCQVSTTIFRAAVLAGLKITERQPHAFPVHYYEPQGFDATVYPPRPDLKFINDTPNHILIQTRIKGTKLYFDFYGTKDDREVKIIGPVVLEKNADGSMKTKLTQEIWRDGKLERQKIFYSNYKSPALYPEQKNPLE